MEDKEFMLSKARDIKKKLLSSNGLDEESKECANAMREYKTSLQKMLIRRKIANGIIQSGILKPSSLSSVIIPLEDRDAADKIIQELVGYSRLESCIIAALSEDNSVSSSDDTLSTEQTKSESSTKDSKKSSIATPVIVNNSICFGPRKYLHWFRGYYYQVSSTPDGYGTVESPYFGMQYLMNIVYHAERYGPSEYKGIKEFVLAISAMTTGLSYYDAMKKMLSTEDGVKEFNEFLTTNIAKHEIGRFNFDTQSILDMFEESICDNVPSDILVQNCVLLENNYSKQKFCVLSIDKESITTVMPLKGGRLRVLRFKLPMWYTDPDKLYLDKDEEEDDYVNPFKSTSYAMESFVQFVLAYSGIKIYSGGMYAGGSSFDRKKSVHANIESIDDTSKLADFISKNV